MTVESYGGRFTCDTLEGEMVDFGIAFLFACAHLICRRVYITLDSDSYRLRLRGVVGQGLVMNLEGGAHVNGDAKRFHL